jgi:hypothetical protein
MPSVIKKTHTKTVMYILPVGQGSLPSEVTECDCDETKGKDHVSIRYKKENKKA